MVVDDAMSYSDYDSDGYLSNEDADYVPSDDNLSEDDINQCEKEDPLHEDDTVPHPDLKKKKKRKDISRKSRKEELNQEEAQLPKEDSDDDEKRKKKSDDLWASFLSDVGSRPKDSAPSCQSDSTKETECSVLKETSLSTEAKPSGPAKVTITKVFDFAGEEVRVDKEVSADSREAKSYLKSQSAHQEQDEETSSSHTQSSLPGPSAKRPAGMSGILNRIGGKKQKMSTLEKSKMDWDAFKSEEGITEELAIHNRGREGFVERKNFLERVDHRQFELEKAVRLSNMKR
ncbi:craniofacial development protein 1 isoform X1 [Xiphophorus couchianus]|uniref:craniofacial development protein 1 isoform X1 n=1 Tax=Xiphophorus couchianus TaxID=32473 RepID=UPI0010170C2C|nr:craniofacial development protein 1 isoform X1 [Xiphophorus couchianus]